MSAAAAPRVAIVGGGLAGLAAAVAIVDAGCKVELFEARRQLGGRAASFDDADAETQFDYCQHVSMGCCTQLDHFCCATEVAGLFRDDDTLHFIASDGQRVDFSATPGLPAPLHLLPGLLRLDFLSFTDRIQAARLLMRLALWQPHDNVREPTVATWLADNGASAELTRRFFGTVLVSALGERLETASLSAARQVFVDGFMRSSAAWKLRVPRVPLREIFDDRVGAWLQARGVAIQRSTPIKQVVIRDRRFVGITLSDQRQLEFDACIVAVPWRRLTALIDDEVRAFWPEVNAPERLAGSPITSVHLWFDRPITPLPHAVLIDRLSQWVFNRGAVTTNESTSARNYLQVVISASHDLATRDKDDVLREIVGDLQAVFPEARSAVLLDSRLVTDPSAVFSVRPGSDPCRLRQTTPVSGLFLAGDWTATGWPATMEGAVRSGYLAAEALLNSVGRDVQLLIGDLPSSWLARMLFPFEHATKRRLPTAGI